MNDVHVQGRGPSVWPWVIGLVVLALLVWALAELFGARNDVADPEVERLPASGAVQLSRAHLSITV